MLEINKRIEIITASTTITAVETKDLLKQMLLDLPYGFTTYWLSDDTTSYGSSNPYAKVVANGFASSLIFYRLSSSSSEISRIQVQMCNYDGTMCDTSFTITATRDTTQTNVYYMTYTVATNNKALWLKFGTVVSYLWLKDTDYRFFSRTSSWTTAIDDLYECSGAICYFTRATLGASLNIQSGGTYITPICVSTNGVLGEYFTDTFVYSTESIPTDNIATINGARYYSTGSKLLIQC